MFFVIIVIPLVLPHPPCRNTRSNAWHDALHSNTTLYQGIIDEDGRCNSDDDLIY